MDKKSVVLNPLRQTFRLALSDPAYRVAVFSEPAVGGVQSAAASSNLANLLDAAINHYGP
jgi:hypothetical protein